MIKRLMHVGVYVRDLDEALRFYTEKLGLVVRQDVTMQGYRWVTVGVAGQPDLELGLTPLAAGGMLGEDDLKTFGRLLEQGKLYGGIFETDNVQRDYEELKARGVEFTQPRTDEFYGKIDAIFRDPSGNWFLLSQDK